MGHQLLLDHSMKVIDDKKK